MAGMQEWVSLPTEWIEDGGLKKVRWKKHGSDGTAALMLLVAIAHYAEQDEGESEGQARVTYDVLADATGLSRTKIAGGLGVLIGRKIIIQGDRSIYTLRNFSRTAGGWGKLPAKGLYRGPAIAAFHEFNLRSARELNALKLYLLIVSRRDRKTNFAHMTYDQIEEYAGIERDNIRSAVSLLAGLGLVHVEHFKSDVNAYGIANAYRLAHIDPYRHMGTTGRKIAAGAFFGSEE